MSYSTQTHVSYRIDGAVAIIKLDSPGVKENVLSEQVTLELAQTFDEINRNGTIRSVVLMSARRSQRGAISDEHGASRGYHRLSPHRSNADPRQYHQLLWPVS
jgi:enoyl-CoA hydratase/carnithine racemase